MKQSRCNQAIHSEKGFTLLETIIAVTLVAMMAIGIWSIFQTGIRSWARGTENIDASFRHRIIYDMVRKQMASAFPLGAPVDPNFPDVTYPFFKGTETSMQFVSLNSLRFQDNPGLTIVSYEVSEDLEGGLSLVEKEDRYLGNDFSSLESTDLSDSISLFDNLSNCHFEYKNPETSENTDTDTESWALEWDAQEKGQLPEAVAMVLEATDTDGNTRTQQIIVPVYATEVYTQTSSRNTSSIRRLRGGRGRLGAGPGGDMASAIGRDFMRQDRGNNEMGQGGRTGRPFGRGQGMGPGGMPKMPPSGGFGPPGGGFGPPGGGFDGGQLMPPSGGFGPPGGSSGGRRGQRQ